MKKRLQGLIAGVLIGVIITGGTVFAKNGSEMIEAFYNNIKIYVDGVHIEPKDASGKAVEPFIYNGTTYLPVRAVGEAIGKTVTWDGTTQSVYLGEKPGDVQYLTDVAPAFQYNSANYVECTSSNGKHFEMGGEKYTNGFYATAGTDINGNCIYPAFYNLNGKYKTVSFVAGALDNELSSDAEFRIYADDKLIKTLNIKPGNLPQKYVLDIKNALQLKIEMCACTTWAIVGKIGMANIVLD